MVFGLERLQSRLTWNHAFNLENAIHRSQRLVANIAREQTQSTKTVRNIARVQRGKVNTHRNANG